jgi:hypothetical protein
MEFYRKNSCKLLRTDSTEKGIKYKIRIREKEKVSVQNAIGPLERRR